MQLKKNIQLIQFKQPLVEDVTSSVIVTQNFKANGRTEPRTAG